MIKRIVAAFLLCSIVNAFAGWDVTDEGSGSWTAVTDPTGQTASLTIPVSATAAVELDWAVDADDVSATFIVNTGSWVWTDNEIGDTYTFDHATGVWSNGDDSDVWTYTPATKKWVQTTGGSQEWQFDGATGYWVEDPDGTPTSWRYREDIKEWERMSDNERIAFYYDGSVAATEGMGGSPTPPYNLRQLNELKIVLDAFLAAHALATGPTAGLSLVDDGDDTWSGSNTANDEKIEYDSAVSGLSLTWKNNGAHNLMTGTITMLHDPDTGRWTWQRAMTPLWPESWEFTTGTWTDAQSSEAWVYTSSTKTWTKGSVTWQHDQITDRWTHNPGGAIWSYSAVSGRWTYDPDGTPWVWEYDYSSDVWTQITSEEGAGPTMPPLVVVQKALVDSVYEVARAAGAFVAASTAGWQTVSTVDGVSTAQNTGSTASIVYTPANTGTELVWATDDTKQTFSYDMSTGAWTWQNTVDPDDSYTWTFDDSTNRWAVSGSSDYWQYTTSSRQWQNKAATITWQRQAATGHWKHTGTTHEWAFNRTADTWTNQENSSVWRYNQASRLWQVIASAPDPLPSASALPPLALVQQELVSYSLDHMRSAKVFATSGLFGWTLSAQGDDVWSGTNVAGDEQLLYNPTRVPYLIENRNTGSVPAQQGTLVLESDLTGDWRVTNSLDVVAPQVTSFTQSSKLWTAVDGTTPWQWQTTPSPRWLETATGRTWTFAQNTKRWTDSVSSAQWSYSTSLGVWTNHTAGTSWKYDILAQVWTQESGTTVSPANMPPLPVIERALFNHIFEVVAARGIFVTVQKLSAILTKQEDDTWLWDRVGSNEALTFDGSLAGNNRLQWTTTDNSRTWKFDPETGAWHWEVVTTDSGTLVWEYDTTTKLWHDVPQTISWKWEDGLIWRNSADATDAWQYDPIAKQWKNLKTNTLWGYYNAVAALPADDVYMWTNITNSTGWLFDEKAQSWVQTAGYADITADLPPEPVRQMTLLHVTWLAAIASDVFELAGPYGWTSIARQTGGTWQGVNAGSDQTITFDARHAMYHVQSMATGAPAWAQDKVSWWYTPTGNWQYRNSLDPFITQHWLYDSSTNQWSRGDYSGASYWTYDGTELSWTHQTTNDVWQYDAETARWHDEQNDKYWVYTNSTGLWRETYNNSTWLYDDRNHAWTKTSITPGENLTMPPRVVVHDEVIRQIGKALRDADAFDEKPQVTWQAGEYEWLGASSLNNAQARYDTRQLYQLCWRDTHTQNSMQYSTSSGDWTWRADNQHWWYRATDGLWGRDTRTSSEEWLYDALAAGTPWTNYGDSTQKWVRSTPNIWTYQPSSVAWSYDATTNSWTVGSQQWLYNFATGAWIELSDTRAVPTVFPPLPLVQQQFVVALHESLTTFFDNPLYAAGQTAPPVQHPLYGSRPLTKGLRYQRYNCSSVLVNADITLDHTTWVHNDVSRNLGRLQAPSIGTNALPALIGGDRAGLLSEQWAPRINLLDSRVACHESLISAGIRWNVCDRAISGDAISAIDAHNTSKIMGYNRGRVLDMPNRRGTVFQLGSAANRMADGTIASSIQTLDGGIESSSTLRDAFIDIYRAGPTSNATVDDPTLIELQLQTAQEQGVAAKEKAYQVLYLAHRSRVNIGWPTLNADTTYRPWSATAANIKAKEDAQAATLFSPSLYGGGQMSIAGDNWYITARDSNNKPPVYPVNTLDVDGVVYVDHGGLLQTTGSFDLLLDTVVAHRIGPVTTADGQVHFASDQVSQGPDGRVQPYQIDFTAAAQSSGAQAGHVLFPVGAPVVATGARFQADTSGKVK